MADAFITRRGGGSGKLFAAIGVTYPAGSTCTCTNGSKTLKAKTTSGQCVFAIPDAGTWTVTATNDAHSKSKAVEITTEGQSVNVTLSYALVLYENGGFSSVAGGVTGSKVSNSGGVIKTTHDAYAIGAWRFKNALSFAGYSTLNMTTNVSAISSGTRKARFGVTSQTSVPTTQSDLEDLVFLSNTTQTISKTGAYTISVDISNINDTTAYIMFGFYGNTETAKVWLE